jgi:hypothetical protein
MRQDSGREALPRVQNREDLQQQVPAGFASYTWLMILSPNCAHSPSVVAMKYLLDLWKRHVYLLRQYFVFGNQKLANLCSKNLNTSAHRAE